MTDIKAIETHYNGYRFRSRLEARWAVFFDALNIKYEYEPEGYRLSDGSLYLPDFKLKGWVGRGTKNDIYNPEELFVEVKGKMTDSDAIKIWMFSESFPVIVLGNIPKDNYEFTKQYSDNKYSRLYANFNVIDGDWFGFGIAPEDCTSIKRPSGLFELCGDSEQYWSNSQKWWCNYALEKARQARFEHGEKP